MMKYYTEIMRAEVTPETVIIARNFADKVTQTTNYSDARQFNSDKIRDDHFISKIGEEAAKLILSKYTEVSGPDYNIYQAQQKSWDDDLSAGGIGLAVKTQKRSSAAVYELSWTFQAGPGRRDIILNRPDAWVIFVEYDDSNPYTCYVYPPYQIKELEFGEPKLLKLKGPKKVVYANTLKRV